jgi:glycosyltransferase involved in cell wall biosynthesis
MGGCLDISLVTSLYRSERFLPVFSQRVRELAAGLDQAGLTLEVILVANDASPDERRLIEVLASDALRTRNLRIIPLWIERETLYASWNRGVSAASGRAIGFWNVDDIRSREGLIADYRLIVEGCDVVISPYMVVVQRRVLGWFKLETRSLVQNSYAPPKWRPGPFFLFSRELYERTGQFDAHFRIAGDAEWGERPAVKAAKLGVGDKLSGWVFIHDSNLSGGRNPLEAVENNVVFLRRGEWDRLRPANPELMRAVWRDWGGQGSRCLTPSRNACGGLVQPIGGGRGSASSAARNCPRRSASIRERRLTEAECGPISRGWGLSRVRLPDDVATVSRAVQWQSLSDRAPQRPRGCAAWNPGTRPERPVRRQQSTPIQGG